jgi:ubiquinone/menaquinone biosynthesis C-methylase UbiE
MTDKKAQTYIPALRYHWLTSLYDPLLQIAMRDTTLKRRLIQQAATKPNQRILDLGCGTATLSLLLKEMCPNGEIIGLDADANVLAIARAKITHQNEDIELVQAMSFDTPFTDTIFDHVFSSLFFHHLT